MSGASSTTSPSDHWPTGRTWLAVGGGQSCARRVSGTVACWGVNQSGELGDGTFRTPNHTSTPVTGISDAIGLGLGADHSCVVRATGAVSCWGANADGQLGNGTITAALTPVAVTGITTAAQVVGGDSHTCARTRTGEVWSTVLALPSPS